MGPGVAVATQVVQGLRSIEGHWALREGGWGSMAVDGDHVSFNPAPKAPQILWYRHRFWFRGVKHSSGISVF